jgi:D-alanyl-D-alanine dipeptidase
MGTGIADFSEEEKIKTFYKGLSDEQKQNRMLLHDLMVDVGFAPFYGEWWHFSYGDKEWAAFYKHSESLYSPINFRK